MAIDSETKRASVLSAGSFFPGRIPYFTEPDGSDLNGADERGIQGWHYAGIDAAGAAVGSGSIKLAGPGGLAGHGGLAGRHGGLAG